MAEAADTYVEWLAKVRAKPRLVVTGATPEEVQVIRSALNLYHGHNMEKQVFYPNMGFGASAKIAEELEVRLER